MRLGRLQKANQSMDAATLIADQAADEADIADAFVTLCVHAGIAASDVICCARLGLHAQGEDHGEAVALLSKADRECAKHLRILLSMKTKAGYSHARATSIEVKRATRSAGTLVETARRVSAG